MVNDFIFELGCEELPSGSVLPLANEFADLLISALDKAQLHHGEVRRFATPRRLAIVIHNLQAQQENQNITRRGPAVAAAYDANNHPTSALLGFAKSCGVSVDKLISIDTDKGAWIVYEAQSPGKDTKELLPVLIKQCLASLSIPKPMRWGNRDDEFARPVHWALMLYGNEVLSHDFLGIQAGRYSRGHRFHHNQEIRIESAQHYEKALHQACVIADFSLRKQTIIDQIQKIAASIDATPVMPDALIEEVTSIVEWPQALLCHFEEAFLEVPAEALIASMQLHQKTFALKSAEGTLLPHFVAVSNIRSTSPDVVIQGNEKVMRARLSDAAFFFKQDKKHALSDLISGTKQVVFQERLGSLYDKSIRMKHLITSISKVLGCSTSLAERAAELSKCDLLTGMVGEFPELQGLMGYYYALHDEEDTTVAHALNEQYMPRFANDSLPETDLGIAISLADRLDTLVGIFAIGQKPSGVKDPFKLRRHALAVVRLLIASPAPLSLTGLIEETVKQYQGVLPIEPALTIELKNFILDRLHSYYLAKGIHANLIHAVRASQEDCLYDLDIRIHALQSFIAMPEAVALSAACKRVNNLLNHTKVGTSHTINEALLENPAEQHLHRQINAINTVAESSYNAADYGALLKTLASLKEPVDAFFNEVMVMVDDNALKMNRLALLQRLQKLLQGVADISLIHESC